MDQTEKTKYLKPDQYYLDLYDKHTVEECRLILSRDFAPTKETLEKFGEAGARRMDNMLNEMFLHFTKGERYVNKESVIRKWKERARSLDDLYETAREPKNITCLTCGRLMYVISKDIWDHKGSDDSVLFMYECPLKHIPLRAFYHTGEEYRLQLPSCPKCGTELKRDRTRKANIVTSVDSCPNCGYEQKDEYDFGEKREEKIDPDFAKDRERFCMTDEDGQKYIDSKYHMKAAVEVMRKFEENKKNKEENKESYEKIAKLKNLKIIEVEQLLSPTLDSQGYVKLQFQTPEIRRDIIVAFTVHDSKDRKEYDSIKDLKKSIKVTLEGTNWRLMSDGVNYRLGMLSGRLRGYEREEDLLELVQEKKK